MNSEKGTKKLAGTEPVPDAGPGQVSGYAPTRLSPLTAIRAGIAGLLMGVANLIPGVSGGTMILAMGLYEEFIHSVADITALRFSLGRVLFLVIVGAFAGGAIVGLAAVILYLLFHYTVAMFALFIGLTLGGAPLLFKSVRPIRADVVVAIVAGLGLMFGVFLLRSGRGFPHNVGMDFVAGVVGSTTMVLPGVSGSYMLLVMDQYERVVGAVDDLKRGVQGGDVATLKSSLRIIVPVGIGAVLGIVLLSNILKLLLRRYRRATVGVLLGILLGSVIGLWPFNKAPSEEALERRTLAELRAFAAAWQIPECASVCDREQLVKHIADKWERRAASAYTAGRIGMGAGLAAAGFLATYALARTRTGSAATPSKN